MDQTRILAVIDLIHQAALEPGLWRPALDAMSELVGAKGVVVFPFDTDVPTLNFDSSAWEGDTSYTPEWHALKSHIAMARELRLVRGLIDVDGVIGEERRRHDVFLHEYMHRQLGADADLAYLSTPVRPDHIVSISALGELGKGAFSEEDKALWGILGRHAARSLTISNMLSFGGEARRASMEVLSGLGCGVAYLFADGRIMEMNAAASDMSGDGFSVVAGHLRARVRADQADLDALLSAATFPSERPKVVGPVRLRRRDREPLLIHALGLGTTTAERLSYILTGERATLVFIVDPTAHGGSSAFESLRTLGLSPMEAKLATLIGEGKSIAESGAQLRMAESTARSMMKSIYNKLDINKQSELVRLVTRLTMQAPRR